MRTRRDELERELDEWRNKGDDAGETFQVLHSSAKLLSHVHNLAPSQSYYRAFTISLQTYISAKEEEIAVLQEQEVTAGKSVAALTLLSDGEVSEDILPPPPAVVVSLRPLTLNNFE